jgi:hypothetical protein
MTYKDVLTQASGRIDIQASGVVHLKGSQVQTESAAP